MVKGDIEPWQPAKREKLRGTILRRDQRADGRWSFDVRREGDRRVFRVDASWASLRRHLANRVPEVGDAVTFKRGADSKHGVPQFVLKQRQGKGQ